MITHDKLSGAAVDRFCSPHPNPFPEEREQLYRRSRKSNSDMPAENQPSFLHPHEPGRAALPRRPDIRAAQQHSPTGGLDEFRGSRCKTFWANSHPEGEGRGEGERTHSQSRDVTFSSACTATIACLLFGLLLTSWNIRAETLGMTNKLGMFVYLRPTAAEALSKVAELELPTCEVYTEDFSPKAEKELRALLNEHDLEVTALFTMGPGPLKWDFIEGPASNGLVPKEWRAKRVARLKAASDFAKRLNIPAIETHVGFVPENPKDPLYWKMVTSIREVVQHCRDNRQTFLYHAGAETAVALLRIIEDVGLDNQGIGLDTANSIMYGTGNPVDALEIYGQHVRTVNIKDGLFPTNGRKLGRETPVGQGRVDFPRFIRRLRELNYQGSITIEREISGPQLYEDVRRAKVYLEMLMNEQK